MATYRDLRFAVFCGSRTVLLHRFRVLFLFHDPGKSIKIWFHALPGTLSSREQHAAEAQRTPAKHGDRSCTRRQNMGFWVIHVQRWWWWWPNFCLNINDLSFPHQLNYWLIGNIHIFGLLGSFEALLSQPSLVSQPTFERRQKLAATGRCFAGRNPCFVLERQELRSFLA